jgi:PAS domain-containing protein
VTKLLIPLVAQPATPRAAAASAVPRPAGPEPAVEPPLAVRGASLQAWSRAVSGSGDPALVLDPEGAVVAASTAAAELLDRPVAELLGRELPKAAGFVDFHAAPRALGLDAGSLAPMLALRSDSPARGLMRVRRDNGSLMTCDTVAAPLHDAKGELTGALVLLKDVTP